MNTNLLDLPKLIGNSSRINANDVIDAQHVGSISINGIYSKQILDIAVVLKSFTEMNV